MKHFYILWLIVISCFLFTNNAYAQVCRSGRYNCIRSTDIADWWLKQHFTENQKTFLKDKFYKGKIIDELWAKNVEPALKNMSAQMRASDLQMTGAMGGMMDGMMANEAILASQTLQAGAYRDYTPGEGLCRFGTNIRSLAASQEHETTTLLSLAQIAETRFMNKAGGQGAPGAGADKISRFKQFQQVYCDPGDNNGFMKNLCYPGSTAPTTKPERFNKDIDYVRTVDRALTLDVNFTDGKMSDDEQDILALSNNLYGYNLFDTIAPAVLNNSAGTGNKNLYLDIRQIAAMRNMAQNSFNAVVASRASGGGATPPQAVAPYMINTMREMGLSEDDAKLYLTSGTGRLSPHAQMEILTKKIYQNPNFYTNLVDKPANVKRQLAAMKAIGLTQDRQIFESLERQELLLSALLELEIRDEQQRLSTSGTGTK